MSENTTEIVKAKSIEQQVAEWSATDAVLIAAVEATKGVTVAGHAEGPKKGREAVHKCLMDLVDLRTPIEKRRKELKRPIIDLGNLVDSEAARLTAIISPRESELRADRDAYDAIEKKRIEDEKEAERLRIQKRVESMVSVGLLPDIQKATNMPDDQFAEMIEAGKVEQDKRNKAAQISQELTALGDECSAVEAYDLTSEQAEHRLTVARKAFADREEAERIKRDEEAAEAKRIADEAEAKRHEALEVEKAARAKLERGSRRSMELASLGAFVDMQVCAEWSMDEFAAELDAAKTAKAKRDEEAESARLQAEQQAAELRRMQEAEAQRIKAENDAKEAARIAQEAKDKEERKEAERKEEQARAEALKPDLEKAQAWFKQAREAIPAVPQIADQKISAALHAARKAILAKIIEEDFLQF